MKSLFPTLSRRFSCFAFALGLIAELAPLAPTCVADNCDAVQFPVAVRVKVENGGIGYDSRAADLNGDGKLDLAILSNVALNISFGDGNGHFSTPLPYDEDADFLEVLELGDFNGDGFPDAAVGDYPFGTDILLNDGNGAFPTSVLILTGVEALGLKAADFNGDGKVDLAVSDFQSDSVSILLGDGTGGFAPPLIFATGAQPARLAAGDFDGDGVVDLAVAEYGSMDLRIFKGTGDGHFKPGATYPLGGNSSGIVTTDFNHDGKLDLAATVFNIFPNSHVAVFLGDGNGGFEEAAPVLGSCFQGLETADLNGDGNADLVFPDSTVLNVALGDGTGGFQPVQEVSPREDSAGYDISVGDFNGDGRIDLFSTPSRNTFVFFNVPTVSITAGDRPASEDGMKGRFIITRNGCDADPLDVFVAVSGTATPGTDYERLKGRIMIPAGQDSAAIEVVPIDDSILEGTETVVLTLASKTTYGVTGTGTATVSILDND